VPDGAEGNSQAQDRLRSCHAAARGPVNLAPVFMQGSRRFVPFEQSLAVSPWISAPALFDVKVEADGGGQSGPASWVRPHFADFAQVRAPRLTPLQRLVSDAPLPAAG